MSKGTKTPNANFQGEGGWIVVVAAIHAPRKSMWLLKDEEVFSQSVGTRKGKKKVARDGSLIQYNVFKTAYTCRRESTRTQNVSKAISVHCGYEKRYDNCKSHKAVNHLHHVIDSSMLVGSFQEGRDCFSCYFSWYLPSHWGWIPLQIFILFIHLRVNNPVDKHP